jgi:hypothetical protein
MQRTKALARGTAIHQDPESRIVTMVSEDGGLKWSPESRQVAYQGEFAVNDPALALAALEAEAKAVFCEKPIAVSVHEGRTLVDAYASLGTVLPIGHYELFKGT